MHRITPTIRRIADAELPQVRDAGSGELRPATDQELLDRGIVHLKDDLYSCVEQQLRDDETLEWSHVGDPLPGQVVTAGDVKERHAKLPADVRGKVLRAQVIRSTDPAVKVLELVEVNLLEQQAAIEAAVGDILVPDAEPRPLVDFEQPAMILEEAQRLAAMPDNGIERVTVAMADVAGDADVVEVENLIPHAWAGERVPR
jgi:hypothetical protein